MDSDVSTTQRSWWWPRKRARRRSSGEDDHDLLRLPNFLADANKLVDILEVKEGHHPDYDISGDTREIVVNELIDARIDSLSSLFRPRRSLHRHRASPLPLPHNNGHGDRSRIRTRATDMTDEQLSDWVLKGACSEAFLRPKRGQKDKQIICDDEGEAFVACEESYKNESSSPPAPATNKNEEVVEKIAQKYASRRKILRLMATELHENRRRRMMLGIEDHIIMPQQFDGLVHRDMERDDDATANDVRIDRYGRLIGGRIGLPNDGAGNNNANSNPNNGNDQAEELELEDASETFWRHSSMAETRRRIESVGIRSDSGNGRGRVQQQNNPPANQPRPLLITNQPMRVHDISRQMDRDACDAIQRALDRYRLQEDESHRDQDQTGESMEQARYELIHIPLMDVTDENDDQPRLSRQDRGQRQAGDENNRDDRNDQVGGNPREQQNRQDERNGGNWMLAMRRICYAVVTVTAAFICIIIQGLPLDFRDDARWEVDGLLLSGLMGPHSQDHHHRVYQGVAVSGPEIPGGDGKVDKGSSPLGFFRSKKSSRNLPLDVHVSPDANFNLQQWNHLVELSDRNREVLDRLKKSVDDSKLGSGIEEGSFCEDESGIESCQ